VKTGDRQRVRARLRHWQSYSDLDPLRDAAALAGLPAAEQAACWQIWADIAALLARSAAGS
jgi:hypothetical protein